MLAAVLRFASLGGTFETSDSVELALKIVKNESVFAMRNTLYGSLIMIWEKLWIAIIQTLGIPITEAWWKFPIALFGVLSLVGIYQILKKERSALWGVAALAVLPIHVMQSRYLWGYEVFGVFFLIVALYAFTKASPKSSGLTFGVYFLSHGYFVPFPLAVLATAWIHRVNWKKVFSPWLWGPVVLLFPLFRGAVLHGMEKKSALGFYFFDYAADFVHNLGIPLLAFLILGGALLMGRKEIHRFGLSLLVAGILYLIPIVFLAPPGVTVVRGYFLCSQVCLVLGMFLCLVELPQWKQLRWMAGGVLILTLAGTVQSVFFNDSIAALGFLGVRKERGSVVIDPGTKAAALWVRQTIAKSQLNRDKVCAVHRAIEPPNFEYYFGWAPRAFQAQYDLSLESRRVVLAGWDERVCDVLILESDLAGDVPSAFQNYKRADLTWDEEVRAVIFYRGNLIVEGSELQSVDIRSFNQRFDEGH